MKKLLVVLLAIVMVISLVACSTPGNNNDTKVETKAETKAPETTEAPAVPLADADHAAWVAHGQYLLADGTENNWGGKPSELYEASSLTAISLKDVKAINEDLYNKLAAKEIKYLYTIDLIFGTNDAGWSTKFLKDGKLFNANGSYAFKASPCLLDEGVYSEDFWIPDAKIANAESLTPDTLFMPAWQEEKDENGFNWENNPVVTGGAGLYTVVVAQYKNGSSAEQAGYGIGMIKKEDKEGKEYEEILQFVPADHTYGIIGDFNGWGDDVAMEAAGDNAWAGEVELKTGEKFKVRADKSWDVKDWGDPSTGSDIVCEADGTYVVTITFDAEGNGTVTAVAK